MEHLGLVLKVAQFFINLVLCLWIVGVFVSLRGGFRLVVRMLARMASEVPRGDFLRRVLVVSLLLRGLPCLRGDRPTLGALLRA